MIQLVSEVWLKNKKSQAKMTSDLKNKQVLEKEIVLAERHLKAKNEVISLALENGYKRNLYDGVDATTGEIVQSFRGFVRKSPSGKWETFSFETVRKEVGHPGVVAEAMKDYFGCW